MKILRQITPREAAAFDCRRIVRSDLIRIRELASGSGPAEELRQFSSRLRELVSENQIARAWRLTVSEPKVPSIVAYRVVSEPGGNRLTYASAATGQAMPFAVSFQLGDPGAAPARPEPQGRIEVLRFSDYSDSSILGRNGVHVSRRQLINYVANKQGGAHTDATRDKKDQERYRLLDSAFYPVEASVCARSADGSSQSEYKFVAQLRMGDRNRVMDPLFAIVKELALSDDLAKFVEAVDENGALR